MIMPYKGKHPDIGPHTFVAPTAVIIGAVRILKGASIWYGTVIRGDKEPIVIGENTNIQDNCTVHTDDGQPTVIGSNVSIGHNAVVHGCRVEDGCLIGIGAVVLSGANIGKGSVIAAGSLVREGQEIGPWQLVAGIPARFKRELTDEDAKRFLKTVEDYNLLGPEHAKLVESA
jgi:carbonic anhydrase/acetyltransferase-like protein (isoleucine patch superfamily)